MSKRQSTTTMTESPDKKKKTEIDVIKRLDTSILALPALVKAHHLISSKLNGVPLLFNVEYVCNGGLQFAWWPPHNTEVTFRVLQSLYATLIQSAHVSNDRKEHRSLVDALIFGLVSIGDLRKQTKTDALALLSLYFGTTTLGRMKQVTVSEQKSFDEEDGTSDSDTEEEEEEKTPQYGRFIDLYMLPSQMPCFLWQGGRYPQ